MSEKVTTYNCKYDNPHLTKYCLITWKIGYNAQKN